MVVGCVHEGSRAQGYGRIELVGLILEQKYDNYALSLRQSTTVCQYMAMVWLSGATTLV